MTYVKIAVIGSDTPATICLEDVSSIGPLVQVVVGPGEPYPASFGVVGTTGKLGPARVVSLRNGDRFPVEPWTAERLEERLLPPAPSWAQPTEWKFKTEPEVPIEKVPIGAPEASERCPCACERCKLFSGPHSIYHVDCCGKTAIYRGQHSTQALSTSQSVTAKLVDESCAACGANVYETPSGLVCVNGHGGPGIVP